MSSFFYNDYERFLRKDLNKKKTDLSVKPVLIYFYNFIYLSELKPGLELFRLNKPLK